MTDLQGPMWRAACTAEQLQDSVLDYAPDVPELLRWLKEGLIGHSVRLEFTAHNAKPERLVVVHRVLEDNAEVDLK